MKVVLFGAAGFLGSYILRKLRKEGHQVFPVVKNEAQASAIGVPLIADVRDVEQIRQILRRTNEFDALIYTVGHCPPGGADTLNARPVSSLGGGGFQADHERLVGGLANVIHQMMPGFRPGGSLVVIGSAITRLNDETCPSNLFAGQYATAQAAQAEFMKWLRRDPEVRRRELSVHRLALGAVDSPFFDEAKNRPPAFLQPEEVARETVRLLDVSPSCDIELLPEHPSNQLSLLSA